VTRALASSPAKGRGLAQSENSRRIGAGTFKRVASWGALAAGTAAALVFVSGPDGGKAPNAMVERSPAPDKSSRELLALTKRATLPPQPAGELFAGASTQQVELRGGAGKPVMPAFPYKYVGWLRGGVSPEVYLERAGRIFPVEVGDVVEGFRIDVIHDERIDVTFLALGQRMSVSLPVGPDGAGNVQGQDAPPAPPNAAFQQNAIGLPSLIRRP
jgi:hypothetical protein